MKLQDLASVRSGLVLSRKQAKEASEYRYPLINLRCIQQEGTIQLKEADIYEAKEPLKEEYLSQSGDIIVRLTAPYTAVLIDETTSGMVVSSNFVVIRVEDTRATAMAAPCGCHLPHGWRRTWRKRCVWRGSPPR